MFMGLYALKEKDSEQVYKARLFACGCLQENSDGNVFSLVAKSTTLRMMTCLGNEGLQNVHHSRRDRQLTALVFSNAQLKRITSHLNYI